MYVDHTGHYAATDKTSEGRTRLLRSADQLKDQTYYLSSCSESQLSRVSFVPPSSPRFCNACSVQLNPPLLSSLLSSNETSMFIKGLVPPRQLDKIDRGARAGQKVPIAHS
jgi:hypothetical protein